MKKHLVISLCIVYVLVCISLASSEEVKVAFQGDSITRQRCDNIECMYSGQSYARLLQKYSNYNITNFGRDGVSSEAIWMDFGRIANLRPDYLFIEFGFNDCRSAKSSLELFNETYSDYIKYISPYVKHIVIVGMPKSKNGGDLCVEYYNLTQQLAQSLGVEFIPTWDLWNDTDTAMYNPDEGDIIHLSNQSHYLLYYQVNDIINRCDDFKCQWNRKLIEYRRLKSHIHEYQIAAEKQLLWLARVWYQVRVSL